MSPPPNLLGIEQVVCQVWPGEEQRAPLCELKWIYRGYWARTDTVEHAKPAPAHASQAAFESGLADGIVNHVDPEAAGPFPHEIAEVRFLVEDAVVGPALASYLGLFRVACCGKDNRTASLRKLNKQLADAARSRIYAVLTAAGSILIKSHYVFFS